MVCSCRVLFLCLLFLCACGEGAFEDESSEEVGPVSQDSITSTDAKADTIAQTNTTTRAASVDFADTRTHYLREEIGLLAAEGVMVGYPDGTFRPNAPLTRAAFAALLSKAFLEYQEVSTTPQFSDVPAGHWARLPITKVSQAGFMIGDHRGQFRPDDLLTREQALVALAGGLNLPALDDQAAVSAFRDGHTLSSWARKGVSAAYKAGITSRLEQHRHGDYLLPKSVMTRADAASYVFYARFMTQQLGAIQTTDVSEHYLVAGSFSQPPVFACRDGVIYGTAAAFSAAGLGALWTVALVEPTPGGEAAAAFVSAPIAGYIGGSVGIAVSGWRGCFAPMVRLAARMARAGYGNLSRGLRSLANASIQANNCTPNQYELLKRAKETACAQARSCNSQQSCRTITRYIDSGKQCARARANVMDQCFGGGDERHIREYNTGIDVLSNCIELIQWGRCINN